MPGSSFGAAFRITTAGESHGPANVVIIDGCPAGLPLTEEHIHRELRRRRPGQSALVSGRAEADVPKISSGVFEGQTTGTPIAIVIENQDARSKDYEALRSVYRPGHADLSYELKYGRRDHRGGGRASARETVARVAAGAVAKRLLDVRYGARVLGWVERVGEVHAQIDDPAALTLDAVEASPVRCPDLEAAARMQALIEAVRADGDSIGGVAGIVATGVPAGLGEPVFDKLEADLAKALFSVPAVVGVEYGAGFAAATLRGSEAFDPLEVGPDGRPRPATSARHGGMLGGISTGAPILLRAAVKPASSVRKALPTVDRSGAPTEVSVSGRHDPCLLPRFVPVAEAMVALVLADHALRQLGPG